MHFQLLIKNEITALALKILFPLHTHAASMLMQSSGFIMEKSYLHLHEKHSKMCCRVSGKKDFVKQSCNSLSYIF